MLSMSDAALGAASQVRICGCFADEPAVVISPNFANQISQAVTYNIPLNQAETRAATDGIICALAIGNSNDGTRTNSVKTGWLP